MGQNSSESNYCTSFAKESGFGLNSHTRLSVHTSPSELHEQFFPLILQHFCRKHAKAYVASWSGSLFRKARTFTDCLRPGNLVLMEHKQNLTASIMGGQMFLSKQLLPFQLPPSQIATQDPEGAKSCLPPPDTRGAERSKAPGPGC